MNQRLIKLRKNILKLMHKFVNKDLSLIKIFPKHYGYFCFNYTSLDFKNLLFLFNPYILYNLIRIRFEVRCEVN